MFANKIIKQLLSTWMFPLLFEQVVVLLGNIATPNRTASGSQIVIQ